MLSATAKSQTSSFIESQQQTQSIILKSPLLISAKQPWRLWCIVCHSTRTPRYHNRIVQWLFHLLQYCACIPHCSPWSRNQLNIDQQYLSISYLQSVFQSERIIHKHRFSTKANNEEHPWAGNHVFSYLASSPIRRAAPETLPAFLGTQRAFRDTTIALYNGFSGCRYTANALYNAVHDRKPAH